MRISWMHGRSQLHKEVHKINLEMRTLPLIVILKETATVQTVSEIEGSYCINFGLRGSVSIYTAVSNYHVIIILCQHNII